METLRQRVEQAAGAASHASTNSDRRSQIGSGERSDKGRTVQEQNDRVVDHRTGKKMPVSRYLKGEIWALH
jgi:peptide chain release factor 1